MSFADTRVCINFDCTQHFIRLMACQKSLNLIRILVILLGHLIVLPNDFIEQEIGLVSLIANEFETRFQALPACLSMYQVSPSLLFSASCLVFLILHSHLGVTFFFHFIVLKRNKTIDMLLVETLAVNPTVKSYIEILVPGSFHSFGWVEPFSMTIQTMLYMIKLQCTLIYTNSCYVSLIKESRKRTAKGKAHVYLC